MYSTEPKRKDKKRKQEGKKSKAKKSERGGAVLSFSFLGAIQEIKGST